MINLLKAMCLICTHHVSEDLIIEADFLPVNSLGCATEYGVEFDINGQSVMGQIFVGWDWLMVGHIFDLKFPTGSYIRRQNGLPFFAKLNPVHFGIYGHSIGGSTANIYPEKFDGKTTPFATIGIVGYHRDLGILWHEVRFDLGLTYFTGDDDSIVGGFDGVLGFYEGGPNPPNTQTSHKKHETGNNQHSQSPQSHFSLGYKVFLGAIMLVAGFYFLNYAFRFAAVLSEGEAILYMLLGIAGVGVGIGFILAYGFAVLPT